MLRRFALAAALALPATLASAYQGGPVAGGGRIAGRILLGGAPPSPANLAVTGEQDVCGASVPDERLVVGEDGGLANVVVSLEQIDSGKPIDTSVRARLDHAGCRFRPHVQSLVVGQVLEVRNSDPLPHATRALLGGEETVFSVSLPIQNQVVLQRMKRPGVLHFESEAGRAWMSAYAIVTDHPYAAVTGRDGRFALDDVPAGTYRLRAWHETLGTEQAEAVVVKGATATVEIRLRSR